MNHKLTSEEFYNILNMLKSEDIENKIVALNLIENLNAKKNIVYILLFYKKYNDLKLWISNAPKQLQMIRQRCIQTDGDTDQQLSLSFNKIFRIVRTTNYLDEEDVNIIFDMYALELSKIAGRLLNKSTKIILTIETNE
jgi:hypothetical protein